MLQIFVYHHILQSYLLFTLKFCHLSKLTYLLRNSLGGDSKTLAIVCCSPHQSHFNESLNSIHFAEKASKVELREGNKVDV